MRPERVCPAGPDEVGLVDRARDGEAVLIHPRAASVSLGLVLLTSRVFGWGVHA